MKTTHILHIGDARRMSAIADSSVHLIVTSPPYPMIEMWDSAFDGMAPGVRDLLSAERGMDAFEAMHTALDEVWAECRRVLVPGGFVCINIGDATRSVGGEFCMYPNHARIITALMRLGMTPLPDILWRKPSNAPNKFMGSGTLPAGAYVTYEHEYILIARKGGKRTFSEQAKVVRGKSAFFWEERNAWFSDLWTDLRGTGQRLGRDGLRERSAAFPFELPFRLVNMFALQGDVVLDPFAGTGTTMAAALAAGRSSIGYEWVDELRPVVLAALHEAVGIGRHRSKDRLVAHNAFVSARVEGGKVSKHVSAVYGFPVTTRQEIELTLPTPSCLTMTDDGCMTAEYEMSPLVRTWPTIGSSVEQNPTATRSGSRHLQSVAEMGQTSLFSMPLSES
jgi:modification methylase